METHDPYRAPAPPTASTGPAGALDMSGVRFSDDGKVASAATIAAGYTSSIVAARWLATLIDFAALAAIILVPSALFGKAFVEKTALVWVVLAVAYFPVMETLLGGALGKLATGTRVVDIRGKRPAWWQSIVRTLLRLLEVNPFLFGAVPAGLVAVMSSNHQRIGDMLARTYVLRRKDIARIRDPLAPRFEPTVPAASLPRAPSPE